MAYLYRHIRLDKNEPFYIGIATHLKRAYEKGQRNHLWKAIASRTNYVIEILFDDLTREQALEKEKEFVSLYGRIDKKTGTLANLTMTGQDYADWQTNQYAYDWIATQIDVTIIGDYVPPVPEVVAEVTE